MHYLNPSVVSEENNAGVGLVNECGVMEGTASTQHQIGHTETTNEKHWNMYVRYGQKYEVHMCVKCWINEQIG